MPGRFKPLILLVILAAAMWLEMFLLKNFNFWFEMTIAASLLASLGLYFNHRCGEAINYRLYFFELKHIFIGIVSAAVLYLIFYGGDYISKLIFAFADKQIVNVYSNKSLLEPSIIVILLLIIGPTEEIFWRGFVQDTLQEKFGDNFGWIIASVIYGAVHLFSLNLMLFIAALVCGLFWGWIFKRYKSLWPGIISHALWDVTIFVVLPVR
jgi:membrane protease YdiL (CAAX protease family)